MLPNSTLPPLRFLITHEPPGVFDNCLHFPTMERSLKCPFPGWILEVTTMIAATLNITIEPIIGTTGGYGGGVGNFENGTWNGLLGAIYNGSVDLVASMYQYTTQRDEYFTFSYPVFNIHVVYISRLKTRTVASYLWNPLLPFGNKLWIILISSWIFQIICAVIIRKVEHKMQYIARYDPFEKVWQYCRIHIHQGEDRKRPFLSYGGHFAFAVFALCQATMFTYLYEASLLASLLEPADLYPFHTASEVVKLIQTGQYKLLAVKDSYKSSWYFSELQQSNELHFRQLREALIDNPIVLVDNIDIALKKLSTGYYIYAAQQDSGSIIRMREYCNLFSFSQGLPQRGAYYLFHKNSTWTKIWNEGIKMNQAFIEKTIEKYFENNFLLGKVASCPKTEEEIPESQKELDIVSCFGIFIIYLIGLSISSVALGCEIWVVHHAKKIIKKHTSKVMLTLQNRLNSSDSKNDLKQHNAREDISMDPAWSSELYITNKPIKRSLIGYQTHKSISFSTQSLP